MMNDIAHNIWQGLSTASPWDQANLVLGITGVWLMVKRTLWAFPVGLVAVTVQGILFWRARFPADALLQVFFFVALAWGWRHWVRDRGDAAELPVTRLSARARIIALALASSGTALWALAIGPRFGAVMPWRDAFIAMFSVTAQVLQARKNVENWPLWLGVNLVAMFSYWSADLAFTAFLYGVYLALAVTGWRAWARAMKSQAVNESTGGAGQPAAAP